MHLLVSYCILGISRVPYLNTNWSMSGWSSISKEKKNGNKNTMQYFIYARNTVRFIVTKQICYFNGFFYIHTLTKYIHGSHFGVGLICDDHDIAQCTQLRLILYYLVTFTAQISHIGKCNVCTIEFFVSVLLWLFYFVFPLFCHRMINVFANKDHLIIMIFK